MSDAVDPTVPPSGAGCVECDAAGGWWFHLRRCTACGHVGCCDDSLARHAAAHWRESTNCPLRYVGGDVFIAGMASLYSPVHPQVFDSPAATPWVSTAALERDGMLYVVDEDDTLPAGVQPPKVFNLVLDEQVHKLAKTIRFAVKLPAALCG